MARAKDERASGSKSKDVYDLVQELRDTPTERQVLHRLHHSRDRRIKRAFRIHRHLRALEQEILDSAGRGCVSVEADSRSERVVLTIRNDELHCCRFAYLTRRELKMLEREPRVARELRTCGSRGEVA